MEPYEGQGRLDANSVLAVVAVPASLNGMNQARQQIEDIRQEFVKRMGQ